MARSGGKRERRARWLPSRKCLAPFCMVVVLILLLWAHLLPSPPPQIPHPTILNPLDIVYVRIWGYTHFAIHSRQDNRLSPGGMSSQGKVTRYPISTAAFVKERNPIENTILDLPEVMGWRDAKKTYNTLNKYHQKG